MNEIKCPNCGEIFNVDESAYNKLLEQVHNEEFEKAVGKAVNQRAAYIAYKEKNEAEKRLSLEMAAWNKEKTKMDSKILALTAKIESMEENQSNSTNLAVANAVAKKDKELAAKNEEIATLKGKIENNRRQFELERTNIESTHKMELRYKEEEIAQLKDFKARQNVKLLGETLEQHCEIEFNKLRPLFGKVSFEKDNDARTGSKGDYIFRAFDGDTETVSIMFEMKNQSDTTATKKKNEDFFKELDKDRREKNCEYAVLVSVLEEDSELYNSGIVDVSHRYEKMYVIRPQFFVPLITLLKNASEKSLEYKRMLDIELNKSIDINNFEHELTLFKDSFKFNAKQASDKFNSAIDQIDKAIKALEKTKEMLLGSDRHLQLASGKVEDVSIKKLTKNSPLLRKQFEDK